MPVVGRVGGLARGLLPLFQLLHLWFRHRAGMDLPWRVAVGPGLAIDHGWGWW